MDSSNQTHTRASITPDEITSSNSSLVLEPQEKRDFGDEVSLNTEEPPSENTLIAWLQVLGAFFCMFNSWGIANTFGAFQTYYETGLLSHETPSRISWIGSIQGFLLLFVGGLVTGPIYDAGHLRGLVIFGAIAGVFGMMMTSICKEYWQVVLAQGLIVGIGNGCLLLPGVAVMPQYFIKRRAFTTGIAASGSSLGGVIYPIIFHKLQPRIGFPWATRVLAFIMLVTLMVPICVMRAKVFPSKRRPLFDKNILRDLPYDFFTLGEFFGFMGMYIPFYYISSYSIAHDIGSENLSFYFLIIINAGSIFGRIVPNFFADITGPLNISMPFCLGCGIIAFCWTSVQSLPQIILFSIFYGFFSGTFVSITGPALATLSNDMSLVGTHMGMSFTFGALGLLVGNPVAGVLLNKGWVAPATFCGSANVLAALCILIARVKKVGWKLKVKA
ncbi:Aspyridones efflux protein apdF [Lachnellula suecica]|uniref:Aspyridones efflux protein apdF n=1 Tax=Lachnellula suecica TaxID=602035 RepID=A0A8T9C8Q0_9HELO|nr:Aspyridones efflux protein apdF [Lachnellula suecica]